MPFIIKHQNGIEYPYSWLIAGTILTVGFVLFILPNFL